MKLWFLSISICLEVFSKCVVGTEWNQWISLGSNPNHKSRELKCGTSGKGIECAKPGEIYYEEIVGCSSCNDPWVNRTIQKECSGHCYDSSYDENSVCSTTNAPLCTNLRRYRCYINNNCTGNWVVTNTSNCSTRCGGGVRFRTDRCFRNNSNSERSYNCPGTNGNITTQLVTQEQCNTQECPVATTNRIETTTRMKPTSTTNSTAATKTPVAAPASGLPFYIYIIIGGVVFVLIVAGIISFNLCRKLKAENKRENLDVGQGISWKIQVLDKTIIPRSESTAKYNETEIKNKSLFSDQSSNQDSGNRQTTFSTFQADNSALYENTKTLNKGVESTYVNTTTKVPAVETTEYVGYIAPNPVTMHSDMSGGRPLSIENFFGRDGEYMSISIKPTTERNAAQ